jgi:nicotinamide mononucleotide (NMN) deamidase PncC
VGLVYLGVKIPDEEPQVRELHLQGDRQQIRRAAVEGALEFALTRLLASAGISEV